MQSLKHNKNADTIKSVLYSDPYACMDDVPSASQMLKQRRKDEARQRYYETLPRKEQHDPSHKVVTNLYHQQMDVPPTPRTAAAVQPPVITHNGEVLVNNLVGGKYYAVRGPQIPDVGYGRRGLGQRRDQLSSLGVVQQLHAGYGGASLRSSSAPSASTIPRNPITGAPTYPVNAVLRTTNDMRTANMSYGSHTKQSATDEALKKAERGEPADEPAQHNPRIVNGVVVGTEPASAGGHHHDDGCAFDATTDCKLDTFQRPIAEPAPWRKDPSFHIPQGTTPMYPAREEGRVVGVPPATSQGMERFGQGSQNYVAPSAAIGAGDAPAKVQQHALRQPNRLGGSGGMNSASNSYLSQHTRSADAAVGSGLIGTHSNNYAARRPDPASDLVNCRTGMSVHHRGVGVDESEFKPTTINHAGAHDKTVQRGGWMLAGRDASRAFLGNTHAKATNTNPKDGPLPTGRDVAIGGANNIPEEDPRYTGPRGYFDDGMAVGAPTASADDGGVYPPVSAQQQHYHNAHGYLRGAKSSSERFNDFTDGPAKVAAPNRVIDNTNPAYWEGVRRSFEVANGGAGGSSATQRHYAQSSTPTARAGGKGVGALHPSAVQQQRSASAGGDMHRTRAPYSVLGATMNPAVGVSNAPQQQQSGMAQTRPMLSSGISLGLGVGTPRAPVTASRFRNRGPPDSVTRLF